MSLLYFINEFERFNKVNNIRKVSDSKLDYGLSSSLFVTSGLEILIRQGFEINTYVIQPCLSLKYSELGTKRFSFFWGMCSLLPIDVDILYKLILFSMEITDKKISDFRITCPENNKTWTDMFLKLGIQTHYVPDIPLFLDGNKPVGCYHSLQYFHESQWITAITIIPLSLNGRPFGLDVMLQVEKLMMIKESKSAICDIKLIDGIRYFLMEWNIGSSPQTIDSLRSAAAIACLTDIFGGGKGKRNTLRKLIRSVMNLGNKPINYINLNQSNLICSSIPQSEQKSVYKVMECFNREIDLINKK